MHGLRVRHRVAGHRERQPGAVHGERTQPGLPRARHVDRGRRQRHAVRAARSRAASPSPATPRPARSRCRGRPFDGNGDAIGGYFVQRLADGQTSVPTGPQACSVTSPAPGDVVPPASGGSVAEVVQVGPDASSVQFTGTVTESTRYSFVVWGFNRAACANTRGGGHRRPTRTGRGDRRAERHGVDEPGDLGPLHRRGRRRWRPAPQIVAVDANGAQIGQPTELPRHRMAPHPAQPPVRRGGAVPGAQLLRVGELRSVVGDHAVDGDAVPHVRAPEPHVGRAVRRPGRGRPPPTTPGCRRPSAAASTAAPTAGPRSRRRRARSRTPRTADRVWLDVEVAGVIARYWNR